MSLGQYSNLLFRIFEAQFCVCELWKCVKNQNKYESFTLSIGSFSLRIFIFIGSFGASLLTGLRSTLGMAGSVVFFDSIWTWSGTSFDSRRVSVIGTLTSFDCSFVVSFGPGLGTSRSLGRSKVCGSLALPFSDGWIGTIFTELVFRVGGGPAKMNNFYWNVHFHYVVLIRRYVWLLFESRQSTWI